jgi:hypothetical protein
VLERGGGKDDAGVLWPPDGDIPDSDGREGAPSG